jgi:hypothetical protein
MIWGHRMLGFDHCLDALLCLTDVYSFFVDPISCEHGFVLFSKIIVRNEFGS